MTNKIIAFCPADEGHLDQFKSLENSLRKFHTAEELPLVRVDNPTKDINFWYRATPIIASQLLEEYDTVVKLDADQIILSPLNELWQGEFDVKVVRNDLTYPIQVWDITHPNYYNCGLVVMKSKEFVKHWLKLCMSSHFLNYQYREQDFLTLLCSDYFNYDVKVLPDGYGEAVKSLWATSYLNKDARVGSPKVMIPSPNGDFQLHIYHSGGGNTPDKMNYKIRFPEEVANYMDRLIK